MLSRLAYEFGGYSDRYSRKAYLDAATCGAVFLKDRALLGNGHAAWALNREGKPIAVDRLGNVVEGGELERGITADIFLIYGMGEYARAADKREFFDFALALFKSVDERFRTNTYRWVPQAVPQGYRSHALSMIMLETLSNSPTSPHTSKTRRKNSFWRSVNLRRRRPSDIFSTRMSSGSLSSSRKAGPPRLMSCSLQRSTPGTLLKMHGSCSTGRCDRRTKRFWMPG